jgi:lipopolysaccharide transport system ATP-binding protein
MFGIVRADGTPVYGVSTEMDGVRPLRESENVYSAEILFPALPLLPGSYLIKAHPLDPEGVRLFDTLERGLTIRGQSREFGLVQLKHSWIGGQSSVVPADRSVTAAP